jgi:epoxyqueuosine reductase
VKVKTTKALVRRIYARAQEFGADLTGIVNLEALKRSPSHEISAIMPEFNGVGTEGAGGRRRGIVTWPEGARSAIVIAVAHSRKKPQLDWWISRGGFAGNTEGNRLLIRTVAKVSAWLEAEERIRCFKIPYHIEGGGVYLKDAAVLAGLGSIGKNNMLITPQYGPKLRLRVMLTDADLPSTGAISFDPCEGCTAPCRSVCPQDAFAQQIYVATDYGIEALPGRNGVYNRFRCNRQMVIDESQAKMVAAEDVEENSIVQVKYCRKCELVCPVGSSPAKHKDVNEEPS